MTPKSPHDEKARANKNSDNMYVNDKETAVKVDVYFYPYNKRTYLCKYLYI